MIQTNFSYRRFFVPPISLDDPWDDVAKGSRPTEPSVLRRVFQPTVVSLPTPLPVPLPELYEEDVIEDCDEPNVQSIPRGCIAIDEVHEAFRQLFPYPFFNKVQSECFETVYFSDHNMVVSGKYIYLYIYIFVV